MKIKLINIKKYFFINFIKKNNFTYNLFNFYYKINKI